MGFGELWSVGFGTILVLGVLFGLVYLTRTLRNRLFPSPGERGRSEAMAELLLFQAELEKKLAAEDGAGGNVDAT